MPRQCRHGKCARPQSLLHMPIHPHPLLKTTTHRNTVPHITLNVVCSHTCPPCRQAQAAWGQGVSLCLYRPLLPGQSLALPLVFCVSSLEQRLWLTLWPKGIRNLTCSSPKLGGRQALMLGTSWTNSLLQPEPLSVLFPR